MSLDKLVADIDDQIKRLTTARAALVSAPALMPTSPAVKAAKTRKKGGYKMTPEQKKHLSDVMKARWAKKATAKKSAKKATKK